MTSRRLLIARNAFGFREDRSRGAPHDAALIRDVEWLRADAPVKEIGATAQANAHRRLYAGRPRCRHIVVAQTKLS
jgi:hypothetical protein